MKKLITDMILLSPFIAVYAAHHELIAMGVSKHIAVGFMALMTALMLIALIVLFDTLRNYMKILTNRRFTNQNQFHRNQINK
jgi:hypothetical protein